MTYSDTYNIRSTAVKFNDVADAIDGIITRNYAGTTTGSSTAYISTPTPAWDSYVTASFIVIVPHVSNTGACTIQISGLPAKDIKRSGQALGAGVLVQDVPTILVFNGVHFEVLLQNISIPTGTVYNYLGTAAPSGWLLCDGSAISRTTYGDLFNILTQGGTVFPFGSGDGSTTFNLPDMRKRVFIGKGASESIGDSDGLAYASRAISHSHTIPDHAHTVPAHEHSVPGHYHYENDGLYTDIAHNHGNSGVYGSVGGADGTHDHTITGNTTDAGSGTTRIRLTGTASGATQSYTISSSSSGHGHGFSLGAYGQTYGTAYSYAQGWIGNGGGSNGNSAFNTSGSTSFTSGSMTTSPSTNSFTQPYVVCNFIVKY